MRWRAMGRSWKGIALLPAFLCRLASAEPPPVRAHGIKLEVERARGALSCPDQATISKGVVERLGYDPFGNPVERVVVASLDGSSEGYSATVTLQGVDGRRLGRQALNYEIDNCEELALVIEFAIAVAIDPQAVIPQSATREASARGQQPGPGATVAAPLPPLEDPRVEKPSAVSGELTQEPPRFDGRLSVAASAAFQAAPTTVPALEVGLELHLPRASLGLGVRGNFAGHENASEGSITTSLLVAELVPCFHLGVLGACGLIDAGVRRSAGIGLTPAHTVSDPYFALGARVAVDLAITRWLWVRPQLDLWIPTTGTTLTVAGTRVWDSPAVSPAAGIALVAAITKPRAEQ
jgi:hypothetical protein